MMKDMRATLIAYVMPPGVVWVNQEGAADLSKIYTQSDGHRFAIVKREGLYEVLDFWELEINTHGWLMPTRGAIYDSPETAVAATVLLNQ